VARLVLLRLLRVVNIIPFFIVQKNFVEQFLHTSSFVGESI